jgi:hypothetical protein
MSLRHYITIMLLATILCWISWIFVIMNIYPFGANTLSFGFFYGSLFFSLVGTLSIVFFGFYSLFGSVDEPMYRHVQNSFKDGVVVASVLTVMLFLHGKELLNQLNTIMLFAALISLLFFLIFSRKISKAR